MEGVSFASQGIKGALETQVNAISQLLGGVENVQGFSSNGDNGNAFRTEVMKSNGLGQHLDTIA